MAADCGFELKNRGVAIFRFGGKFFYFFFVSLGVGHFSHILVGGVIFLFFLSFLLYFLFRGVAMVSLWPGAVKTEYIQVLISCHISFHVKLKII